MKWRSNRQEHGWKWNEGMNGKNGLDGMEGGWKNGME